MAVALLVQDGHGLLELAGAVQAPDVRDGRVGGEEVDELGDAAVVVEDLLMRARFPRGAGNPAFIPDRELQPGNQERGLPGPRGEVIVGELGVGGEDLPVGPVADPGSRDAALGLADHVEHGAVNERFEDGGRVRLGARILEAARFAPAEGHLVGLAAAVHLDVEAGRQGVDHGGTDAMQAARGRVGAAAELSAGVQFGENHLDAGQPGFWFDVHGDAAAVVVDLHGIVGVQDDLDVMAEPGEGLVDGVVDDFPEAVHESAGIRGADVHARALTDGLKALQHGEVPGGVIRTGCHGS